VTTAALTLADLRTIDLFAGVEDAELERWLAVAEAFSAEPGDVIIEQDDPISGMYLLLEGRLETQTVSDGRLEPLGHQLAPTWMGAIAAITERPMLVRMVAETDCRLALIPGEPFIELARANRAVHQRIMHTISPVMTRLTVREANRERLASLGTMAAGLAHELNNPAAAAKRAASSLVEALDAINGGFAAFVEGGIERAQAEQLLHLAREAIARAAEGEPLDAVAASDAEDAMLEHLEDLGVPEPWRLAEPLAFLDEAWLQRTAELAGPVTPKALAWVAAIITARGLATELLDSTDRMSKLVSAVKTYAYMDRGELVTIDVHEGLESTLLMLKHKLKQTQIKVVRDYDKTLPPLTVRGSELNQVWTNLLDNAIQALGPSGTITVRTRRDGPCAVVDIGDDGPGIPPAARAHVLDPFFTTKPVGSGTGLGLDTARRIVEERHRGSLGFDTGDGGTVFHVWLPFKDTAR
jgi:signal transduction histidine kinase